jgi:hypothetical protein
METLHSTPPHTADYRKNVTAWRGHNQRRWKFEKDILPVDERAPFVCECTSGDCLSPVALTMLEFEAAHMCPSWLAVIPGHVLDDDASRVTIRHDHFWVVELGRLDQG